MATKVDINAGPINLRHDINPRQGLSPTVDDILKEQNYRYKGYPAENFVRPHDPVISRPTDPHYYYGKPSFFDKLKPTIDEGHDGVQYGDNIPRTGQSPKPMMGAIPPMEKTSAVLRKLRHQHDVAQKDIHDYKSEQMRRMEEMQHEKKLDLKMLKDYNPWGKPGGGAPQTEGDIHYKQKFLEQDVKVTDQKEITDFHKQFGKPGHGAPRRSSSGKIIAEVRGDPMIRMHIGQNDQIKSAISNAVRYTSDKKTSEKYANALENQVFERALNEQETRVEELKKELETLRHDPYGKPGAGAPNRSQSETPEEMNDKKSADGFNWGQGYGRPVLDGKGNVVRHPFSKSLQHGIKEFDDSKMKGLTLDLDETSGGGGAPVKSNSGKIKTKMAITMDSDRFGQKLVTDELAGRPPVGSYGYYPYGRPGHGAPLTDREGKVQTIVHGKSTVERDEQEELKKSRAAHLYLVELQREADEHRRLKQYDDAYRKAPVGEFARVINDGLVGKPKRDGRTGNLLPQHLTATDVTKLRTDERPIITKYSKDYHDDLSRAAEERFRLRQLEKLKEKQEVTHHQVVFDDFWGRPGGGAPNVRGTRRHDPIAIIHSPRTEHDNDYVKSYYDGGDASSPRAKNMYVRSTVPSTHDNHYEYVSHKHQKKAYDLMTPWAVEQ